jgi:hypothetical protein
LNQFDRKKENKLLNLTEKKLRKLHNFDKLNDSKRIKQLFSHFESSIVEPKLENIELLKEKNKKRKNLIYNLINGSDEEFKESPKKTKISKEIYKKDSIEDLSLLSKTGIFGANETFALKKASQQQKEEHKKEFIEYLKKKINYVEPKYTKIEGLFLEKNKREKERKNELKYLKELYSNDPCLSELKPELGHILDKKRSSQFRRKTSMEIKEVKKRKWSQGLFKGIHKIVFNKDVLIEIKNIFEQLDDHKTNVISAKKLILNMKKNDYLSTLMKTNIIGFANFGSFGGTNLKSNFFLFLTQRITCQESSSEFYNSG